MLNMSGWLPNSTKYSLTCFDDFCCWNSKRMRRRQVWMLRVSGIKAYWFFAFYSNPAQSSDHAFVRHPIMFRSLLTSLLFDQKDDTLTSIWDDILPIKGRSLWQVKDDIGDKTWWQFIFSIKGAVNWINFVWLAIKLTPFFFLQLSGFTLNAQVLYPRHKHLLGFW